MNKLYSLFLFVVIIVPMSINSMHTSFSLEDLRKMHTYAAIQVVWHQQIYKNVCHKADEITATIAQHPTLQHNHTVMSAFEKLLHEQKNLPLIIEVWQATQDDFDRQIQARL